jgi:hypothetical protein
MEEARDRIVSLSTASGAESPDSVQPPHESRSLQTALPAEGKLVAGLGWPMPHGPEGGRVRAPERKSLTEAAG